jgi:alpha-tubulin suppressor-like RCC1 family protein
VLPRSVPVQVDAGTTWSQTAAGGWYVMALKQDGSLWTWGSNELGRLGKGNQLSYFTPVLVPVAGGHHWLAVACGFEHTLAIRDDHTLWAWGSNHSGELGVGDTTTRLSPTQVGAEATWSSIACGSYYSLAIKADGSLWAWGDNTRGELGLGAAGGVHNAPVRVGLANDWLAVSGAKHDLAPFTLALKTDHTLWAWA